MRRFTTALLTATAAGAAIPAGVFAADGGTIDSGDTAWMLAATALVMIMLPGLARVLRRPRPPQERAVHDHA